MTYEYNHHSFYPPVATSTPEKNDDSSVIINSTPVKSVKNIKFTDHARTSISYKISIKKLFKKYF